jgi:hypothetical protein
MMSFAELLKTNQWAAVMAHFCVMGLYCAKLLHVGLE